MRLITAMVLGGALALFGCDSDGGGGAGGPVITMVAWAPVEPCTGGVGSDYTITVTATDADSDAADLLYDGSVAGCTGQIDDVISTITCPNAAPYAGTVVVEDGDGNVSNTVNFTIAVCVANSVSP